MYVESLSPARTVLTAIFTIQGILRKPTSGVLPLVPCSPTKGTLRASQELRPFWTGFLNIPLTTRGRRRWQGQFRKYD